MDFRKNDVFRIFYNSLEMKLIQCNYDDLSN